MTPSTTAPFRAMVRWGIVRDLEQVAGIEHACRPDPLDRDGIRDYLRSRNAIIQVAEIPGTETVCGVMRYRCRKHALILDSLCVHPAYRGRGVGTTLIHKLQSKLSVATRHTLIADVRESNLPGLKWLSRRGWKALGLERDAFGDEDGIVMTYSLARSVLARSEMTCEQEG